jgi:hypothetical protein
MGLPAIKNLYMLHALLILTSAIIFQLDEIFPEIITLFFIEGQGRILWEYAPWARIIFDLIILIAILRIFIFKKKILNRETIPIPILSLIGCHFFWYSIQFFNTNAASTFGVVSALKIYVYPILFFLGLTHVNLNINKNNHALTSVLLI